MSDQPLPVEQGKHPNTYKSFPIPEEWKKEEEEQSEISKQPRINFDFPSVSKMGLVLLTNCNNAFDAFLSIFNVPIFKISAEDNQQPQQKSTGLLSNMLTFFKSLSGSKPQAKSTEQTIEQEQAYWLK